ncbi:MAG: hypothetical protein MUF64_27840 [Polyangiaceae bacterium]|nr:hypothetical protein [Polyangiaceae bacterium]
MTDPLPPDLEDLFRRARLDAGEPERLARVAARLPLRPSIPPWQKIAGGGALIAALGLLGSKLRPSAPPTPAPAMDVPVRGSAPAAVPASAVPAPSGPPVPPETFASAEPLPRQDAAGAAPRASRVGAPPPEDPVAEHALLAEARRSLGSSPAKALELVQQHQRRFPRGELGLEREFLRIQALLRLGRGGEARAAGERFLRSFPRSTYAAEVERLIR